MPTGNSSAKPWITVAVEGIPDEAAARRILDFTGFAVSRVHGGRGKDQLDRNLRAYSLAARHGPWLVLRDLDRAECAPSLRVELEPSEVPDQFLLRIAKRSMIWFLQEAFRRLLEPATRHVWWNCFGGPGTLMRQRAGVRASPGVSMPSETSTSD